MIGSMPTFSVSEFVSVFNQSLEIAFPFVGVTGELSNFRVSKGAWVYFDLKDEYSSVKFFGSIRVLPGPLQEGMNLEVVGRPYLHPKFGFSIQVNTLRPVGEGTIKKAHELLEKKLRSEGLFDVARKRALRYPPTKVGLITSAESAGYSDFMKIVAVRWPMLHVTLFDVLVQGQEAPRQIISAIEEANQRVDLDVLVLARGGGAADDLSAFNHEQVVRAVAASRLPTLVGVGHERDVVLSELAADKRASTPSNAAELLVPSQQHEQQVLGQIKAQLTRLVGQKFEIEFAELKNIDAKISLRAQDLFKVERDELQHLRELVAVLDPRQLLKRGYVLAISDDGNVIRSAKKARVAKQFSLRFCDADVRVGVQ